MTKDEALKIALEAFEAIPEEIEGWIPDKCTDAVIAIKKALAQPEQETVAIVDANDEGYWADILPDRNVKVGDNLYTTPPQRTWVELTDDEREELMDTYDVASTDYVHAIEAKLKEKNT